MLEIKEALKSVEWSTQELPPLSNSAQGLLNLSKDDREDPRLLALFAQKDPVLLGRLLALANSALSYPSGGKPVTTIDAAIRQLGVTSTYATMLGASLASAFADKLASTEVRKFLVQHTFTRWNTGRNLCRFLALDTEQSFVLQLAALLEPLGVYAALLYEGDISNKVRERIQDAVNKGLVASCENCEIAGYTEVSAEIAAAWGAPKRIVDAITAPDTEDGALKRAVDSVIAAKLKGDSQAEALMYALTGQDRWRSLMLDKEVDLVCFG